MNTADFSSIHRRLDDAFAGIPMTPELQDLKEEIRASLTSRVLELQSGGMDADAAAVKAMDELGDIRDAVESTSDVGPEPVAESAASLTARNRVRPHAGFVVRTVLLSLVLVAGVTILLLGDAANWSDALLAAIALVGVAFPISTIVLDASRQETSQNYPLPEPRARGYSLAALVGALGLSFGGLFVGSTGALWLLVGGIVLAVVSLVAFVALGVTQTNRKKPWALSLQRSYELDDPFSKDPAAAARFGIYTVVIWVVALALFGALSILVGFLWSWIALVLGVVVFMLVLSRMVFPADRKERK